MPLFFALTLFVSATLLFLVQPMIGKMILPRLGGTPAVWNTCMVFFQALLLVGYGYTHAVSTWLNTRRQVLLQAAVLALPFLVLPFTLGAWRPPTEANPIPALLWLLLGLVGLPFLVVATSAPLLQRWFASTGHPSAKDPYFLYGASNLGSMLALLCYPLVVEPGFPLAEQTWLWMAGYGVLVALILACGAVVWLAPPRVAPAFAGVKPGAVVEAAAAEPDTAFRAATRPGPATGATKMELSPAHPAPALTLGRRLRWVALAAVPSSLMLGVTTYLTTDIAAIPLFWVLPLALYLLTFILVFMRWPVLWTGKPHVLAVAAQPVVVLLLVLLDLEWAYPSPRTAFTLNLLAFFVTALVCHGELARDRPPVRHLTEFYLWMAVGGVLGGMFNTLVAPLLFVNVIEYMLVLVLALALRPEMPGLFSWLGTKPSRPALRGPAGAVLDVGYGLCAGLLAYVLIRLSLGTSVMRVEIPSLSTLLHRMCAWFSLDETSTRVTSRALRLFLVSGIPLLVCLAFAVRPFRFAAAVGAVLLAAALARPQFTDTVYAHRSFFGVQRVCVQDDGEGNEYLALIHGGINHGWQSRNPARRREAITYFHPAGPIGQVFKTISWPDARLPASLVGLGTAPFGALVGLPSEPPYAVIGLGIGTLAAHARPTQHVTFYEIDPAVVRLSLPPPGQQRFFTYLQDARDRGADLHVVLGDGRLSLENAPEHYYRVLVIDAFSSDAIPVHLLTAEAIDLYLRKLADGGVLVFNVTNRYVDLGPVLADVAQARGLVCYYYGDTGDGGDKFGSDWIVLARKRTDVSRLPPHYLAAVAAAPLAPFPGTIPWAAADASYSVAWPSLTGRLDPDLWQPVRPSGARVWTDDYTNLLRVMIW